MSQSTIKTSRSLSTRSTGRVKGAVLPFIHLFVSFVSMRRMFMPFWYRIAYVECHDRNSALVLKNWFDAK